MPIRLRLLIIPLLISFPLWLPAETEIVRGTTLHDIELRTRAAGRVRLSALASAEPLLLILTSDCTQNTNIRVSGLRVIEVVGQLNCASAYVDASGELTKALPGARAVLIDTDLSIRRTTKSDPAQFADEAEHWLTGKQIYAAQCALCHGPDGRNDEYPGIKLLHGIGRRIGEPEIIERTVRSGNVDLHRFSDSEKRALAIFVAGL